MSPAMPATTYPNVETLKTLAKRATLPEYKMRDITGDGLAETFCNRFVNSVAMGMGCKSLANSKGEALSANQIVEGMRTGPDWSHLVQDWASAQRWADMGYLVIAGRTEVGHGHVNIIVPGPLLESGAWGCKVPTCANVGRETANKRNWVADKLSFAFRADQRPSIYAWKGPAPTTKIAMEPITIKGKIS